MQKNIILTCLFCLGLFWAFGKGAKDSGSSKQYMLIFRFRSDFVPPSPDSIKANIKQWQDYMASLKKTKKLVTGFRPGNDGETITGSSKTENKGVYIANNELISSVIIINAESADDAKRTASQCPIFNFNGSVEVRPVLSVMK
jgi:hypothetical protein